MCCRLQTATAAAVVSIYTCAAAEVLVSWLMKLVILAGFFVVGKGLTTLRLRRAVWTIFSCKW